MKRFLQIIALLYDVAPCVWQVQGIGIVAMPDLGG
jgi:hypothetical protein